MHDGFWSLWPDSSPDLRIMTGAHRPGEGIGQDHGDEEAKEERDAQTRTGRWETVQRIMR